MTIKLDQAEIDKLLNHVRTGWTSEADVAVLRQYIEMQGRVSYALQLAYTALQAVNRIDYEHTSYMRAAAIVKDNVETALTLIDAAFEDVVLVVDA